MSFAVNFTAKSIDPLNIGLVDRNKMADPLGLFSHGKQAPPPNPLFGANAAYQSAVAALTHLGDGLRSTVLTAGYGVKGTPSNQRRLNSSGYVPTVFNPLVQDQSATPAAAASAAPTSSILSGLPSYKQRQINGNYRLP